MIKSSKTEETKSNLSEGKIVSNPLVSIITVVYNGEKYIEQTILSVINQTYKNIEYIIVDGNSKDSTLEIIKRYDSQISYWLSEPDSGIYNAMNKGINLANGAIIGIINSDDWYELNAVEKIVSAFENSQTCGVFNGILRTWRNNQVYSINGYTTQILENDSLPHPATFIKKEIYNKYGLYNEKYKIVADYELFLRLNEEKVNFCFLEEIIANFRIGGESSKSNKFLFEKFEIQYLYGNITYFKKIVFKIALFIRNLLLR